MLLVLLALVFGVLSFAVLGPRHIECVTLGSRPLTRHEINAFHLPKRLEAEALKCSRG